MNKRNNAYKFQIINLVVTSGQEGAFRLLVGKREPSDYQYHALDSVDYFLGPQLTSGS